MSKRKSVNGSPSRSITPVDVTTRDWLDIDWPPPDPKAVLVGHPIVRFSIHAHTAAEASTADRESRAWALDHGAYKVARARRIIDVQRQVRMELPDAVTRDPGSSAHDPALIGQYLARFPAPDLSVDQVLKIIGYTGISANGSGHPFTRLRRVCMRDVSLFRELDIEMPEDPLVALTGDIGQGKSAFVELAFPYALAGELRSGTVEKLGRRVDGRPSPSFRVAPEFILPDGRTARVERGREKRQAVLEVYIDDVRVAEGAQADAYICEHLLGGRSVRDVLAAPFVRQGDIHQFSEALRSDRSRIMREWFHLDRFDRYRATVADKVKAVEPNAVLTGPSVDDAQRMVVDVTARAKAAAEAVGNATCDLEASRGDLAVLEAKVQPVDHGPRLRELERMLGLANGLPNARQKAQDAKTAAGKAKDALEAARSRVEALLRTGAGEDHSARIREIKGTLQVALDIEGVQAALGDPAAQEADRLRLEQALPAMREARSHTAGDLRESGKRLAEVGDRIARGFDGACPIDQVLCPRKDDINGNRECAQRQRIEAEQAVAAATTADRAAADVVADAERELRDVQTSLAESARRQTLLDTLRKRIDGVNLAPLPAELARLEQVERERAQVSLALAEAQTALKRAEADATARDQADAVADRAVAEIETQLQAVELPVATAEHRRLTAEVTDAEVHRREVQPRIDAARARVAALDLSLAAAHRAQGQADVELTQATEALALAKAHELEVVQAQRLLTRLQYVDRMCGPDGLPALILENLVAGVEATANDLLAKMDYPLQVAFSFESEVGEKAKICDCGQEFPKGSRKCPSCGAARGNRKSGDLDIQVLDASGAHEFGEESGGRKALVSVAVRISVALLLGFRWIVADEVDSALSDEMVPRLAQMLRALPSIGMRQVFWTSHRRRVGGDFARTLCFERNDDFCGTAKWEGEA